jgi:enoyl-CoA hydratase/carnithine racemase
MWLGSDLKISMVEKRMENVYVQKDDHRVDVVLDRPEKRNAMSEQVVEELIEAFEFAEDLDDARAVTLTGEGPVFCAGMDLEMMSTVTKGGRPQVTIEINELFDMIDEFQVPVVVGIKGAGVAGGFEITLPADLRVIGENAKYGVAEVKMGLFPAGGTTQRLPRIVGMTNAKEITLLGDYIDPMEAKQMGLVNEVCPDDEVDERTKALGDEIAERSPLGVQRALKSFQNTFELPLEEGLQRERELCRDLFGTRDVEEGFSAALEERTPEFEGR